MLKEMKLKRKEKVEEVKKYPAILDEITFDVELGVTHAHNPENSGYRRGEESMLKKVKEALS